MSRRPAHEALPNGRGCSCRFRKPRELRKHLAIEGEARTVWISTPESINPHRKRRH